MGTETKIYLPDLGDFHDVAVIEVLVAPGYAPAAEAKIEPGDLEAQRGLGEQLREAAIGR